MAAAFCLRCGAPVTVPPGARLFDCASCGARLEVVVDAGVQSIRLAAQLSVMEARTAAAEIDHELVQLDERAIALRRTLAIAQQRDTPWEPLTAFAVGLVVAWRNADPVIRWGGLAVAVAGVIWGAAVWRSRSRKSRRELELEDDLAANRARHGERFAARNLLLDVVIAGPTAPAPEAEAAPSPAIAPTDAAARIETTDRRASALLDRIRRDVADREDALLHAERRAETALVPGWVPYAAWVVPPPFALLAWGIFAAPSARLRVMAILAAVGLGALAAAIVRLDQRWMRAHRARLADLDDRAARLARLRSPR